MEEFLKNGLICFPSDLSEELIDELRNKITKNDKARIGDLFQVDKRFSLLLKNEKMKNLLDEIYDKRYHLTTFSSNTLRKSDRDGRYFHVDYPYHNIRPPFSDEILGIQVNFALDNFMIENGATLYIPDSFLSRSCPSVTKYLNMDEELKSKVRYMTVPKGYIILYRGDMWHSQGINVTNKPRVAVLANFSPLHIPPKGDILLQISKCRDEFLVNDDGRVLLN